MRRDKICCDAVGSGPVSHDLPEYGELRCGKGTQSFIVKVNYGRMGSGGFRLVAG